MAVALAGLAACTTSPSPDQAQPPGGGGEAERTALEGRPAAATYAGGRVWVAEDDQGRVIRLDAVDGERVGETLTVGPQVVAATAAANAVWLAHADGTLTRIDEFTDEIRVVARELGVLVDVLALDGAIWVADIESGTVHGVDPASGAVTRSVPVPAGAVRLAAAPGGTRLWVAGMQASVTAVDVDTGAVGDPVQVGTGPIGMAVVGDVVWVTNSDDGTVSRLDAATGAPAGPPVPVGAAPIAVAPGADRLWVLNQDSGTVTPLHPDGRRAGDDIDLGLRPRDLVATPTGLWVAGVDPAAVALVRF